MQMSDIILNPEFEFCKPCKIERDIVFRQPEEE